MMTKSDRNPEARRLAALARYGVLDTPREATFDELAELASAICRTPIAVVNFVGTGRQFFKAEVGLGVRETPLETSFCAKALLEEDFLLVPDATKDQRFDCNPLVTGEPHLRFYAGALLKTAEGFAIGTLCVLDYVPRQLDDTQQQALRVLARQVMAQLELRHTLAERAREVDRARSSEERLQLVLDSAKDYAILTTDPERRITSWSAGAQAVFGWTAAEAMGRSFDVLFTPEDRAGGAPEEEAFQAEAAGLAPDVRWHLRADGRRVFMNGSVHPLPPDDAGRAQGFLKIARDETERRHQTEELARTRAELVGSEARFRALIDISASTVWTTDVQGLVVEDSPSWRAFTGQSVDQRLGSGWMDAVHPDDRDEVRILWAKAIASGDAFDTEFRLWHAPSERWHWTRVRAAPLRDKDGSILEWVGMNADTDDRKQGEIALAESEARFRNMADNAPVMMWVTDPVGYCTYLNRRWYEFTGQDEEEATGFGWLEATHPDDKADVERMFVEANAAHAPFRAEYRLRRADGTYRWAIDAASPRFGSDGQYLGYVGSVIDIEERREAEERLRRSEEQSRLATEAADVGLWDVDLVKDTLFWPLRVKAMFGISADVPVSMRDFYEGLHPEDLEKTAASFAAATDSARRALYDVEYRTIGKEDGIVRWVAAKGRGVFDEEDICRRVIGTAIDITARKKIEEDLRELNDTLEQRVAEEVEERAKAEEQLRQAQKMEAVGQLTGGIAHDFNNLLTGVIGSLDLMQRRMAQGQMDKIDRYATAAMTSANRAAALTHRLLAFSRRQPLDPKPVQANRLVTGMEELLRRTIGEAIQLEIVTAGGLWLTLCDPHQLESAILNLAINARDAMPGGGTLTIETCNAHLDSAYAARSRDVRPGQYVCICVTDTGTGMSPDVIEKAFDPFFTTKPIGQGTGLGLSMIYGFARQSEGYARIYSEVGEGTTIKLYLPRYHGEGGEADELDSGLAEDHRAEHGEVVLVVEDETAVRDLVIDVLEELGYRAIEAADGPSGLKLLESQLRIDLLITDVGLPGLNGRQLADAARQSRPDLKILFMTGYAENAAVANGFLEPGMQMITKPFAIDALTTRIREMIAGE